MEEREVEVGEEKPEVKYVNLVIWVVEVVDGMVVISLVLLPDGSAIDELPVTSVPCVTGVNIDDDDDEEEEAMALLATGVLMLLLLELILNDVNMITAVGLVVFGEETEAVMLLAVNAPKQIICISSNRKRTKNYF